MDTTIELTFIGHEAWLFSAGGTNILADPILGSAFGNSVESTFEMRIYPPRTVDHGQMPRVDAVILSHEHIDHFNLETFAALDRRASVFVGERMLDTVVQAIEALGFAVTRCRLREPFRIGAFRCALYPATAADIAHERRVTQMLLWTESGCNIYNGVDCKLSPDLERDIQLERVPAPRNLILSNNGMLPSEGARRAYYNVGDRPIDTRQGIPLLRSMLREVHQLPQLEHVFVMGNGLLPWGGEYGPFAWSDNAELADMVNELSQGPRVLGPYPGDQYRLGPRLDTGRASWIELHHDVMEELKQIGEDTRDRPPPLDLPVLTRPFESDAAARAAQARVEAELVPLATALLATSFGQTLQVIEDPAFPALGPRRLIMRFQGGPGGGALQYALDVDRGTFVPDDTPRDELVAAYPHGLEMQLCDFDAIVEGRLGVFDIFFAPVQCWFLEDMETVDSILIALGNVYGEQASPGLVEKINERAVRRFSGRRAAASSSRG